MRRGDRDEGGTGRSGCNDGARIGRRRVDMTRTVRINCSNRSEIPVRCLLRNYSQSACRCVYIWANVPPGDETRGQNTTMQPGDGRVMHAHITKGEKGPKEIQKNYGPALVSFWR